VEKSLTKAETMVEKYYEEELRYLYESGRQFAKAHPDQARFLNIDAVGDRDPYVERLFEGFAFLAARIREKLDDSFPELSEGMIDLLWPHLQQEIPSVTMVEFKPRSGYLTETKRLPRGIELLSRPVGPDNAICTFTTTQEVPLNPLSLASVEKSVDKKGKGTITFRFRIEPGVTWSKVKLEPLRLCLHAELPVAMTLHELLTRHVVSSKITFDDGGAGKEISIEGPGAVTGGGLRPSESLLPCDSRAYWGYALLLEYFAYPEKFLFVDLHGFDLEQFAALERAPERLGVSLTLDRDFPRDRPFGTENFRLFCSPAVNLFRRSAEPVPTKITENEYLVTADIQRPASFSAHSVVAVTGIDRASGQRSEYDPLHSFKSLRSASGRTFAARYRRGPGKKRDLVLSIGGRRKAGETAAAEENLSVETYFTNGSLARDEIREGGVSFPGADFPNAVSFANITRPTLPCPPPADEHRWTFLAHLGASYSSLASADRLKAFLKLYDWSESEGRRRRIDAVTEVTLTPAESLVRGSLIRGVRYTVTIEEGAFADTGDLHLFGEVLAAFFSHYVSINALFELEFSLRPSGTTMTWDSLRGKRWPV
jgi:type VI secretion system protein ImpG